MVALHSRRVRRWLGAALAGLLVLTACDPGGRQGSSPGRGDGPESPSTTGDGQDSSSPPRPTLDDLPGGVAEDQESLPPEEADPQPIGPGDASARSSDDFPRWDGSAVVIADARLVEHERVDRFVVEFDGDLPSWQVRPLEEPVREQPGRAEVELDGTTVLQVRLVPATSLDLDDEDPTAAYEGPTFLAGGSGGILEAVLTGDDDQTLTFSLGVDGPGVFAVATLEDPARLVVDVFRGG